MHIPLSFSFNIHASRICTAGIIDTFFLRIFRFRLETSARQQRPNNKSSLLLWMHFALFRIFRFRAATSIRAIAAASKRQRVNDAQTEALDACRDFLASEHFGACLGT